MPSTPGDLTYLSGHLYTLSGRMAVALEGDVALCDQQRPSHRITMRARDGSQLEIGAGWLKTTRNGPQKGKKSFFIQVDHPERSGPLNVAAFLDEITGDWVIAWRRRRDQSSTGAATAA